MIVLGAFYYGYTQHEGETLEKMLYAWVLPNSIMAGLLAIVAGAKPLTVLTVAVASPITSLNPTIGAGMVGGLVEAWLRRPTVADCERVPEESTTLRGIYRNKFTRVLLVAVLSTIGSALGAYVGAGWVVTLL
jgi:pheromone shutdown protein TraB